MIEQRFREILKSKLREMYGYCFAKFAPHNQVINFTKYDEQYIDEKVNQILQEVPKKEA